MRMCGGDALKLHEMDEMERKFKNSYVMAIWGMRMDWLWRNLIYKIMFNLGFYISSFFLYCVTVLLLYTIIFYYLTILLFYYENYKHVHKNLLYIILMKDMTISYL